MQRTHDRSLDRALGCPSTCTEVSVSTTSAATTLSARSVYRVECATDVYILMTTSDSSDAATTTTGTKYLSGLPEFIETTDTLVRLAAILSSGTDTLKLTLMLTHDGKQH